MKTENHSIKTWRVRGPAPRAPSRLWRSLSELQTTYPEFAKTNSGCRGYVFEKMGRRYLLLHSQRMDGCDSVDRSTLINHRVARVGGRVRQPGGSTGLWRIAERRKLNVLAILGR